MKLVRILSTAFMTAATALPVFAQGSLTFSYDTGTGDKAKWGTLKKENYDVAIRIDDANLVGKQIKSVTVPFESTADLSDFTVWLSKELTLETVDGVKQNVPDITSVDAVVENNQLLVTFAEPYTITDEGVYVGYSFKVDNLTGDTSYPIIVSSETNPNGLYLHTSRTYRSWEAKSESLGAVSVMTVELSGDYPAWQPNPQSEIVELMKEVYRELFNDENKVQVIHAGLECGVIGAKYPNMDMVSFGPTLRSPHTPNERCYIPSVERYYQFVLATLERTPKK